MPDAQLTILDWKTGTFVAPEHLLQLGGYAGATLHQEDGVWHPWLEARPTQAAVIHVGEDGCSVMQQANQAELETATTKFLELVDVFEWLVARGNVTVPENEAYRTNGHYLPSVTYILSHLMAKPKLLGWYAKMAKEGKDPNQIRDEKAALGTRVHKLILFYLEGKEVDISDAPEWLVKAWMHFERWARQVQLNPVWTETKVARWRADPQGREDALSYAGTLDCLAWCQLPDPVTERPNKEAARP